MRNKQKFCHILGVIFVRSISSMIKYLQIILTGSILLAIYVEIYIRMSIIKSIVIWRITLHGLTFYVLMRLVKQNAMLLLELKMNFKHMLILSIIR
jgi:hypothetical protein